MRPRLSPRDTASRIGVCLEPDMRDALEDLSDETGRKLSDLVREFIQRGLDEHTDTVGAIKRISGT